MESKNSFNVLTQKIDAFEQSSTVTDRPATPCATHTYPQWILLESATLFSEDSVKVRRG